MGRVEYRVLESSRFIAEECSVYQYGPVGGFLGMVANHTSTGHMISLGVPHDGHVATCETSFARLWGPETDKK